MKYTLNMALSANKLFVLPETVAEEVLQNLYTLLSTVKGAVPLYRDFGINADIIDRPIPVAKSLYINEIYEAINKYESRAEIVSIRFDETAEMEGKIIPILEVNIND